MFETGIRPLVDAYLAEKAAQKRSYGDYWSASSAGYCMRKNIFDRLGVPASKPADLRKHRVFESGHIFHEWMQRITKNAGLSIAQEVELQDEDLMIRGHIDDLILIKEPYYDQEAEENGSMVAIDFKSRLILYDYKTQNSGAFTWQKKNGNKLNHYHKMQVGTYMYMLRNGAGVPKDNDDFYTKAEVSTIAEARIMKISKDDLRMGEQQVLWSPELEKEVVGYWKTLNGYWAKKQLPRCTCADYENGFMARETYNDYFYNGEPCSSEWLALCKKEGKIHENTN